MATTPKPEATRPLIQIDDEVREMTEEEFAAFEISQAEIPVRPETPTE